MFVDQRYFAALRIPLLQGRLWSTDENNRGDFIAVVNRAFATRYLSSSNAMGRQLRIPDLTPPNRYQVASAQSTAWRQIIGVVGDARNDGVDRPVVPAIYLPYTTVIMPYVEFLVRTQGDPLTYLHSIRAAIASVASDQQISNSRFTAPSPSTKPSSATHSTAASGFFPYCLASLCHGARARAGWHLQRRRL